METALKNPTPTIGKTLYISHYISHSGNMETLKCDAKGRIYLKEQVRKKYGKEFVLLEARDELILLPVPKDPLKALQEMGKKLPKDMTVKQIREEAREAMMKEIEEEL